MTAVQTYVVERVTGNEDKPDKGYGAKRSIRMDLKDVGNVEWYTSASTQPPAEGSQITGTVEKSEYGLKFKKAQQGGGRGGGGQMDPARERRIVRQHSQDMSIGVLVLAERLGLEKPFDGVETVADLIDRVKKIADAFDKDAMGAGQ